MYVVMVTNINNLRLLVLKNGWADLFHLWVVDSTELEHARYVIKYISETAMVAKLHTAFANFRAAIRINNSL